MQSKSNPSTALPEQEGETPISDREAWLRLYEAIRPNTNGEYSIICTNEAFDAMKRKLEDTHGTK